MQQKQTMMRWKPCALQTPWLRYSHVPYTCCKAQQGGGGLRPQWLSNIKGDKMLRSFRCFSTFLHLTEQAKFRLQSLYMARNKWKLCRTWSASETHSHNSISFYTVEATEKLIHTVTFWRTWCATCTDFHKYKYDVEGCMIHTRHSSKWINYSCESPWYRGGGLISFLKATRVKVFVNGSIVIQLPCRRNLLHLNWEPVNSFYLSEEFCNFIIRLKNSFNSLQCAQLFWLHW